jgi:hypothetical protein
MSKGIKGTCALCGLPWDMGLHWQVITGENNLTKNLVIEHKKFGIIHDSCNKLYDQGEFQELIEALDRAENQSEIKSTKESQIILHDLGTNQSNILVPINDTLEVIKAYTLRKSSKWWTLLAVTRSTVARNPRSVLSFYRWCKRKNGTWKRYRKWSINSEEDWERIKKIVDTELKPACWKHS